MAYEQKDNSGSLFRNDRKEQENHPDHTGTCKIQGREYYISAWIRETKTGKKFFSLAFKAKLASDKGSPPTGGRSDSRESEDETGSIPF